MHLPLEGPGASAIPKLSDAVHLVGEYHGSGFNSPQYLLRRGDGRMLLISDLLHLVFSEIDGHRNLSEIAAAVTSRTGRQISAGNVAYLIEKLRPLGIMAGAPPSGNIQGPVLAIAARKAVIPQHLVGQISGTLRPLFQPVAVVAVIGAIVVMETWLLAGNRFRLDLRELLERPAELLAILALTLAASAFHELGHATASYYGGANPGVIGVGVYLVWPAFYSDLTDSYRLSRVGRLRADLGGIYFNLIFMLLLTVLHLSTGLNALILAIIVQHLVVLQQFIPFVRLDGYYVVSDLTGVPDLFGHMKAVLAGLVPWRRSVSKLSGLRPMVRAALTVWAVATLALLTVAAVLLTRSVPVFAAVAAQALRDEGSTLARSLRSGEVALGLVALMHIVVLAIHKFGLGLMGGLVVGRLLSRPVRAISVRAQRASS